MKTIDRVLSAPKSAWVGNGFPVRSMFDYIALGDEVSPFLLLDYTVPVDFEPSAIPRGVEARAHRGFEVVTLVYQGEIEHRDSTGYTGLTGPGDVEWMTVASGLVHEESHSTTFTRTGGRLELVQLWVNLPAKYKTAPPSHQAILHSQIPAASLPGASGVLRVIAGEYGGHRGPARTFSPLDVWDVHLDAGSKTTFSLPQNRRAIVVLMLGQMTLCGQITLKGVQVALLGREDVSFSIVAHQDSTFLVLSGDPLNEPVVGAGPFVMNTVDQILTARRDLQNGKFGQIAR
ncbi:MAG: quercetin 2,3-dioxygenase [Ramlibacter sp.]|nr:quercetin 2,3-dioxygenase [Ramlibacter sp.]